MDERQSVKVDFTYGETDPEVVRRKAAEIIGADPEACKFHVGGWTKYPDRDGGYFEVSWESTGHKH